MRDRSGSRLPDGSPDDVAALVAEILAEVGSRRSRALHLRAALSAARRRYQRRPYASRMLDVIARLETLLSEPVRAIHFPSHGSVAVCGRPCDPRMADWTAVTCHLCRRWERERRAAVDATLPHRHRRGMTAGPWPRPATRWRRIRDAARRHRLYLVQVDRHVYEMRTGTAEVVDWGSLDAIREGIEAAEEGRRPDERIWLLGKFRSWHIRFLSMFQMTGIGRGDRSRSVPDSDPDLDAQQSLF